MLDIKYRFTCGYSDLCSIIKKYQKYYDQFCLKTFLVPTTLVEKIQLFGKSTNFVSHMLVPSKNN